MTPREKYESAARDAAIEFAAFEAAIGRFVIAWADTEMWLYRVLVFYAEVRDEVGRAILSGARASQMTSFLRAVVHNLQIESGRADNIDFVLSQIASINTVRDQVVHFSSNSPIWFDHGRQHVITNVERVSRSGNHFVTSVGASVLEKIVNDLASIRCHLEVHLQTSRSAQFVPWTDKQSGVATTWLYKPAQPSGPSKRGAPARPRAQRPRGSSRG